MTMTPTLYEVQSQRAHRTGLVPAQLHSQWMVKVGLKVPIEPPEHPAGKRVPAFVRPGAKVSLTAYSSAANPEHLEFRRVVCMHGRCEGKSWSTVEECKKAHPTAKELKQLGECHPWLFMREIPAEGTRPASVALFTIDGDEPDEAA